MPAPFIPITSFSALERVLADSRQHPVVVFKHDTTCAISAAAYRQLAQLRDDVAVVDVGQHNDLAQDLAARTGIEHQSPQVIVFRDGTPTWSASLYDITTTEVEQAMYSA